MTEQQAFLLKMLKEIHAICEKHGIRYVLAGGTLIGAVRHGGFLPWDDDLDLYMVRSEWERFVEACKTDLPPNRSLQAPELDLRYCNTFPRYVSTDTTAIHAHQVLDESPAGEVIDILVLDPLPDDSDVLQRYTYDVMLYSDLLNYSLQCGRRFGVTAHDYTKYLRLQKRKGKRYIRDLFEHRLASYFSDEGSIYAMRWGGNTLVFDRAWFEKPATWHFVDFDAMVPCGINEYLVYHYGDEWAQVPAAVERSSHDAAASLAFPYTEVEQERITGGKCQQKMLKALEKRKKILLKVQKVDFSLQTQAVEYQALCIKLDLEARLQSKGYQWNAACGLDTVLNLLPCFVSYFNWQLSAKAIGRDDFVGAYRFHHPILVNLSDELFYIACLLLFMTERVGKAKRLLDIRKEQVGLSEQLENLNMTIENLRTATNYYWHNQIEEALVVLEILRQDHPENPSILKLYGQVLLSDISANKQKLESLLVFAQNLWPTDGDFFKYKGDVLLSEGNESAARACFEQAIYQTHNGINLLDIYRKTGISSSGPLPEEYLALEDEDSFSTSSDDRGAGDEPKDAVEVEPLEFSEDEANNLFHSIKQEHLFGLLSELCRLCESQGIEYLLHPQLALWMDERKELAPNYRAYGIIIDPHDAERLNRALIEQHGNERAFEYIGTNKRYPELGMHYVDTTTLRMTMKFDRVYHMLGMYVTVLFCTSDRASHVFQFFTRMRNSNPLGRSLTFSSLMRGFGARFILHFGRPFFVHALLKRWSEQAKDQRTGKVSIGTHVRVLPDWLRLHTRILSFAGENFCVPYNLKAYFTLMLGDGYNTRLDDSAGHGTAINLEPNRIEGLGISYRIALEQLVSRKSFYWRSKLLRIKKYYPALVYKRFKRVFGLIKQAVATKDLMQHYQSQKAEILVQYARANFEELSVLFEPFALVAEKFPSAKGLTGDPELFFVFLRTMEATKRMKTSELRKLKNLEMAADETK